MLPNKHQRYMCFVQNTFGSLVTTLESMLRHRDDWNDHLSKKTAATAGRCCLCFANQLACKHAHGQEYHQCVPLPAEDHALAQKSHS